MKLLLLFAPALLVIFTSQDEMRKELAKFTGTWQPVYVEIDGKELKDDIKDDRLVITGNSFSFKGPKAKMEGKLTIDPAKTPRTIDEETTAGDNKGVKTVGI